MRSGIGGGKSLGGLLGCARSMSRACFVRSIRYIHIRVAEGEERTRNLSEVRFRFLARRGTKLALWEGGVRGGGV